MLQIMMEELEDVKIEDIDRLLAVMEDHGMLPPTSTLSELGLDDNYWEDE